VLQAALLSPASVHLRTAAAKLPSWPVRLLLLLLLHLFACSCSPALIFCPQLHLHLQLLLSTTLQ
jgi:hypothetical protein